MSEQLRTHIPDEYVAAWNKMSLDELMAKSERLLIHLNNLPSNSEQFKTMKQMWEWLNEYIESSIKKTDIDLNTFL